VSLSGAFIFLVVTLRIGHFACHFIERFIFISGSKLHQATKTGHSPQ
jgi:hypothetical protein